MDRGGGRKKFYSRRTIMFPEYWDWFQSPANDSMNSVEISRGRWMGGGGGEGGQQGGEVNKYFSLFSKMRPPTPSCKSHLKLGWPNTILTEEHYNRQRLPTNITNVLFDDKSTSTLKCVMLYFRCNKITIRTISLTEISRTKYLNCKRDKLSLLMQHHRGQWMSWNVLFRDSNYLYN